MKKKKKPVKKLSRPKRMTARVYWVRACKLWKAIAYHHWGRQCWVQRVYPHIRTIHNKVFVVDHVITKLDTNLYFHTQNNVVICSNCNFLKRFDKRGLPYVINQICISRIGQEAFDKMMYIHQTGMRLRRWRHLTSIKQTVEELTSEYERIKNIPQQSHDNPEGDQGKRPDAHGGEDPA